MPRLQATWTGDVWKLAFELARSAGIDFKIVTIDHGIGIARLADARPALTDLSKDLHDKGFAYFHEHHSSLPLTTWDQGIEWIRSHRAKI